jgi:hypothetical protein
VVQRPTSCRWLKAKERRSVGVCVVRGEEAQEEGRVPFAAPLRLQFLFAKALIPIRKKGRGLSHVKAALLNTKAKSREYRFDITLSLQDSGVYYFTCSADQLPFPYPRILSPSVTCQLFPGGRARQTLTFVAWTNIRANSSIREADCFVACPSIRS